MPQDLAGRPADLAPVVIVLFGATGDLSRRMVLPAIVALHARGSLPGDWHVVASGRQAHDDEWFRDQAAEWLHELGQLPEDWGDVRGRLRYAGGGFSEQDPGELLDVLADVRDGLDDEPRLVHYLAVPPVAFAPITEALGVHRLADGSRVVFEKPYGTSLASFEELERRVTAVLDEEQIYRIDHFLGKEAVQNLYALRFANELIGGVWSRQHVSQVQIDVPEDLDVADRAAFYDSTGAALDMLVTHLFQVAAQVAMEPPADVRDAGCLLEEREAAIARFRPVDPDEVVLGQVEGYRDLDGVAADSTTDTFVAARLWIDNERWRDVPFLLRSGKRMAAGAQQVTLVLRPPRGPLIGEVDVPDTIQVSLAGTGSVSIGMTVKTPGPDGFSLSPATATVQLEDVAGADRLAPYVALLLDVLTGDRSMFTTAAGLRAAFAAFAPLQGEHRPAPLPYAPGSWGPAAAAELVAPHRWFLGQ